MEQRMRNQSIMKREFNVIIERDEDGYFVASVPSLPGCHTQAKSLDDLTERIQEAILLCLEFEDQQQDSLDFVGIQRVAVEI
ncbi:type II toxin-antitoxin system HicB family antitoxin [Calothrix sp. NIES-2100]|uniref:type II toxin-antitoxin system HicB family antitoxin n=1 Tax=Calothrix sp. NIES-2100 TaxID=1954172 RepID=UPI0030D98799